MKTTACLSTIVLALVLAASAARPVAQGKAPEGFVSLFNGKDLTGWKIPEGDGGHWKVVDGVIDYDAGSQAKFAALLNASEAFAQIEESLRAAGMTLEQAAQMAPATAMLDQAQSQTQLAQQTADSIVQLIDGVSTVGDAITAGFAALQASMEAGLGAIAGASQATQHLLEGMEGANGGLMTETAP